MMTRSLTFAVIFPLLASIVAAETAFFALGPSNVGERAHAAGATLSERYTLLVADR